jgi:hypothetical protein
MLTTLKESRKIRIVLGIFIVIIFDYIPYLDKLSDLAMIYLFVEFIIMSITWLFGSINILGDKDDGDEGDTQNPRQESAMKTVGKHRRAMKRFKKMR